MQFIFSILNANTIDSLKQQLDQFEIAEKIKIVNKIASLYLSTSMDSAIMYANMSVQMAISMNDIDVTANSLYKLGGIMLQKGETEKALLVFDKGISIADENSKILISLLQGKGNALVGSGAYTDALICFQSVLKKKEEIKDTAGMADILNNIGVTYYYIGDYERSVSAYQEGIDLYVALGNKTDEAMTLGNVAMIYNEMDDFEKAEEYSLKALDAYNEIGDVFDQVAILSNLSNIYKNKKDFRKCIEFSNNALDLSKDKGFTILEALIYNNLGLAYDGLCKYDSAMYYYQKALEVNRELQQTAYIIQDLRYVGSINRKLGNYKLALKNLDESEQLAVEINYLPELYEIYHEKAEVYASLNDFKKAYKFHQLYTEIKDTLFTKEKHKQIKELQTKYETEKKEKENAQLLQENSIQRLEIVKNRQYLVGLVILLVIIFVLALLFIMQNRIRNRQKALELEQKLFRSQMNPHFIFNSLSAVQHYILTNKPVEAGAYLADFAKLMRLILESSREELVPLQQEVDTMKYYLEMQKLRFEDGFQYHIKVDSGLDTEDIELPPMLTQPFIENAIEHGFKYRNKGNELFVRYMKKNGMLRVEIEDNGVGRLKASETKRSGHKSFAMEVTIKRLERLNRKKKQKLVFEILDLTTVSGEPGGTKVIFQIPVDSDFDE